MVILKVIEKKGNTYYIFDAIIIKPYEVILYFETSIIL